MASIVEITADPKSLAEAKARLNSSELRRAEYQAVKRTTQAGAKIVKDVLKELTTLKSSYLSNQHGRKKLIDWTIETAPLAGIISINHQPLPLIAYQSNAGGGAGVAVMISRQRSLVYLKHAFLATVASSLQAAQGTGHKGIFLRSRHLPRKGSAIGKGKLTAAGFAGRLAIVEQFGPAVTDLVSQKAIGDAVLDGLDERFAKNMESQIDRFLGGQPAKDEPDGGEEAPSKAA